jgi:uncharacterized protein
MDATAHTMHSAMSYEAGRGVAMNEGRVGDWMQTWTGVRFYPADPRPEDVDILDIAFALGNIARYGGHCRFYSVAEHSVLVSHMVPKKDALAGLLHDATEAYIADVIRPVKRCIGRDNTYFSLEKAIWEKAICPKFEISPELSDEVLIADAYRIIALEKQALHPRSQEWDLKGYEAPKDFSIQCFPPYKATRLFLNRYCALSGTPFAPLSSRFLDLFLQDSDALGQ